MTRILLTSLFLLSTLIGGSSTALAGQTEYDVINDAGLAASESGDYEAGAIDMLDIFMDTVEGSYCEQYAGMHYAILFTFAYVDTVPEGEYDPAGGAMLAAVDVLLDELDAVGNRCLNEE